MTKCGIQKTALPLNDISSNVYYFRVKELDFNNIFEAWLNRDKGHVINQYKSYKGI